MAGGKRRPGNGRTKLEKAEHQARVADLYNQGRPLMKIAAEVGIGLGTVCRHLEALQKAWLESSLEDFDQAKARELARIDLVEREMWEAWFESKKESTITSAKTDEGGKVASAVSTDDKGHKHTEHVVVPLKKTSTSIKRIKRTGNPDYMASIQWCIETRCKIRGFFAPVKLDVAELDRILDQAIKNEAKKFISGDMASDLTM